MENGEQKIVYLAIVMALMGDLPADVFRTKMFEVVHWFSIEWPGWTAWRIGTDEYVLKRVI